jgi:hypothetical protein
MVRVVRVMRKALIDHELLASDGFKLRGKEVSRLEGFSDAAFAFAVTLLVVSLEVPESFDELLDVMRGVPAFAVCFAILVWVWVAHYRFFRRFGLEDRLTIALNSMLLFVVMLYVYPLKFVFTSFMHMLTGIRPSGAARFDVSQLDDLFIIYGIGFAAVFGLLGLMNLRAYWLREGLGLSPLERVIVRQEIARCLGLGVIGLISILLALVLSGGAAGVAGMAYFLIGVVEYVVAARYGRQRQAIEADQVQTQAKAGR